MTIQNINLLYGQSLRQWEQYDTILQPVLDLTTKVCMKNYVDSKSLTLSYSPSRLQSLVPQPIYHLVPGEEKKVRYHHFQILKKETILPFLFF